MVCRLYFEILEYLFSCWWGPLHAMHLFHVDLQGLDTSEHNPAH